MSFREWLNESLKQSSIEKYLDNYFEDGEVKKFDSNGFTISGVLSDYGSRDENKEQIEFAVKNLMKKMKIKKYKLDYNIFNEDGDTFSFEIDIVL